MHELDSKCVWVSEKIYSSIQKTGVPATKRHMHSHTTQHILYNIYNIYNI